MSLVLIPAIAAILVLLIIFRFIITRAIRKNVQNLQQAKIPRRRRTIAPTDQERVILQGGTLI